MTDAVDPADHQTIERLVHEHAWLIDHGQAARVAGLFTEDGCLFGVGPDKVGRAAVAAWAEGRQAMTERRSRHVQTNLRLDPMPGGTVRGTGVLTLYRHDGPGQGSPAPLLAGEYDDVYVKGADGQWRFAERRLTVLFGG